MAFPSIPTSGNGRIASTYDSLVQATRTFPNLSDLTKSSGDLLIAVIVAYQTGTGTNAAFSGWTGGFTEFHDSATATTMAIGAAYKWSTGSETGTFAVTQAGTITGHAAMIVMAISGAHGATPPEAGGRGSGTTTAANAGALTPSWGAADTLWIAVAGCGEVSTSGAWTGIASAPTTPAPGFTDYFETGLGGQDVAGAVEGAVAFLQSAVASVDAGAFSLDVGSARSGAITIAVRPVPAKISTLVDTFATQDTGKWSFGSGASVASGQLTLTNAGDVVVTSQSSYDVSGSELLIEHVSDSANYSYFEVADGSNNSLHWLLQGSDLLARRRVTGVDTVVATLTYDSGAHRWWRISESGGTVTWWTAPDGLTWTSRGTWSPTFSITSLTADIGSNGGTTVWDNFNSPPTVYVEDGLSAAAGAAAGVQQLYATIKIKAGLGAGSGAAAGVQDVQHPATPTRAGTGAAAGASAGVSGVDHEKTGLAAADGAAAGTETVQAGVTESVVSIDRVGIAITYAPTAPSGVKIKAGKAAAAAVAAGASALTLHAEYVKAGAAAAVAAAAGTETVTPPTTTAQAGTAAAAGVGAGAQAVQSPGAIVKAGLGATAGAAGGPQLVEGAGQVVKVGIAAAGLTAAGVQAITYPTTSTKAGTGATTGVAAGTRTLDHGKASTGAASAVGAGPKAVQGAATITKAGLAAAVGAVLGPRTVTHPTMSTKAGLAATAGVGAGAKLVQQAGAVVKVGLAVVEAVGAGARAVVRVKAGTGATAGAGLGGKVRERAGKAGLAAAATAGLGGKVRERAGKAGTAAIALVVAGGRNFTAQRTGNSVAVPTAAGTWGRDSDRAGIAVLEIVASGRGAPLPSSLTQGVAIPGYAVTETALPGYATAPTAVSGNATATDYYVTSGR